MSKKILLLCLIIALTGVLSIPAQAQDDDIEVTWWLLTGNDARNAAVDQIIAEFEEANPNITITLERRATDPHKEALRVAAGTDAFPDLYFMWSGLGLGGEFVEAGMSEDMTRYYEQYGWADFLAVPALAGATQYGGYHGVLDRMRGEVIYYRKDLLEAAGVTVEPTTYEEMIAVNEALLEAGTVPIQFGGTVNWHLMRLLDNMLETFCGAATHDGLKSMELSWAKEPCVEETFSEFAVWADKYIIDGFIGLDNSETTQLQYAGVAAMALEGDWNLGVLESNGQALDNYGIFHFPTGTGRLYGFTEGYYMSPYSEPEVQDAAAAFLDYLLSEDVQAEHLGLFGALSVNTNVEVPEDAHPLMHEYKDLFANATGAFVNGDQAFPLLFTTEYWRIQNLVAIGDLAPEDAGPEFQEFIDNNR